MKLAEGNGTHIGPKPNQAPSKERLQMVIMRRLPSVLVIALCLIPFDTLAVDSAVPSPTDPITTPIVQMGRRNAPSTYQASDLNQADIAAALPKFQIAPFPLPGTGEIFKRKLVKSVGNESLSFGRAPTQFGIDGTISVPRGFNSVRVEVSSSGAKHLRSAWRFSDSESYEVTTINASGRALTNRTGSSMTGDPGIVWSPVSDGATQEVVIKRQSISDEPWTASLELVAHFDKPLIAQALDFKPQGVGDSAGCQKDIACVLDVLSPSDDEIVLAASRGVAIMVLTTAAGGSGTCTGTLLNSANFPRPLFITANHCTEDAVTLDTYWFFSRTNCGFGTVSPATQVTGGAQILWASKALDSALLELSQMPPSQASYTGWNASPVSIPELMLAIHHPKGDVKKASLGNVVGVNSFPVPIGNYTYPTSNLYLVDWEFGIVEPGSSGSAFFTMNSKGDALQVQGTLTGGNVTCSGIASRTFYQRFDYIFPYISGPLTVPAPPPAPPANYQGLWWNAPAASESGWGINLAHQGDTIFATWFTYDATGNAWWLAMTAHKTSNNTYSGTLYETRGPTFDAVPFNPTLVTATAVGTGTLMFTSANAGTFAYSVYSTSQTKPITRQSFGPLPTCTFGAQPNLTLATNYQDLWWAVPAGSESGWGINFTHQGDTIFATWFTYDDYGPLWLVMTAPKTGPGTYSGTLYLTTGPPFSAVPFDPTKVESTPVGTATLTFTNGNAATFSFTVNRASGPVVRTKQLTRQVFVSPGTTCH